MEIVLLFVAGVVIFLAFPVLDVGWRILMRWLQRYYKWWDQWR